MKKILRSVSTTPIYFGKIIYCGEFSSSWSKYLKSDGSIEAGNNIKPRQIRNSHFTIVNIGYSKSALLVAKSESCAIYLGLYMDEATKEEFVEVVSGSENISNSLATVYGCHSFGQWFGQLGDGRAISIGETDIDGMLYELQLKGCGRTPYSRGFDGKAVLRSSIREFLGKNWVFCGLAYKIASEAMYHLGVPTTRALSVVATGEELVRPWYRSSSSSNPYFSTSADFDNTAMLPAKFPPDTMIREPGAIVCRVSQSFLRFGHLEWFGIRKEIAELIQMANFVCYREYPHLLLINKENGHRFRAYRTVEEVHSSLFAVDMSHKQVKEAMDDQSTSTPERYVALFREIAKNSARLVAEWLRVGYVHGNMNSDNVLLAGRTVDYGPFGFMEQYSPIYQPFTTDEANQFGFTRQPQVMKTNVQVLGQSAFIDLLRNTSSSKYNPETETMVAEIERIANVDFDRCFWQEWNEMRRRKLGWRSFSKEDQGMWQELERLMTESLVDYTIFFRELSTAAGCSSAEEALDALKYAFYDDKKVSSSILNCYAYGVDGQIFLGSMDIQSDAMDRRERIAMQNAANPKYILRNWMCALAYERSRNGDHSLVNELLALLEKPYEEQSAEMSKWYRKTPSWAMNLPGVTFMSCSS